MHSSVSRPLRVLLALTAASACQEPGDEPLPWRSVEATPLGDDGDPIMCMEPVAGEIEDYAFVPSPAIDALLVGSVNEAGVQLDFGIDARGTQCVAAVALTLGPVDGGTDTRTFVDLTVRSTAVRIVNHDTRAQDRVFAGVVLDAGARSFAELRLLQRLNVRLLRSGPSIDLLGLALIDAGGATVAMHDGGFDEAAAPGNCLEEALVRFGPIPWNTARTAAAGSAPIRRSAPCTCARTLSRMRPASSTRIRTRSRTRSCTR
jgi:hypothetical protein